MADSLTINRTEGHVLLLHLAGRLDMQTRGELLEISRQAHEGGTRFLLIDLGRVEVITSAGLDALHRIFKLFTPVEEFRAWEAAKRGEPYKSPYFKLASASPEVFYILDISGFAQNIPLYPDLDSAIKSFPG